MLHIKTILFTLLLTFSLHAQPLSMENVGQNIQTSLPTLLKGQNREIVANIYAQTNYVPLWVGKNNEKKTSQLIQALKDPLFNYKEKSFDQKAIAKLYYMLDNNEISGQKKTRVYARLDLLLTNSMVRLVRFIVQGDVDWKLVTQKLKTLKASDDVRADWEIKVKTFPSQQDLINAIANGTIHSYLKSLLPMQERYTKLVNLLKNYKVMDKFPKIKASNSPLEPGDWSSRVPEVKKRLQITGD